jgi:hypothetical protein
MNSTSGDNGGEEQSSNCALSFFNRKVEMDYTVSIWPLLYIQKNFLLTLAD